jgi:putative SOS response-associated peptidase YedK
MCGRYVIAKKTNNKFPQIKEKNYNVCPGSYVPIIVSDPNSIIKKKWSFTPIWSQKNLNIINCRYETMNEKPSFRMVKRCVFVADGWYEWKKTGNSKTPYYFCSTNLAAMFFAGIYNENGCCIVTKEANNEIKNFHHRQPVILDQKEILSWIEESVFQNIINSLDIYQVGTQVNNPSNNVVENIDKIQ